MFYVEAKAIHEKNYDKCLFREVAIGDNKKACIRKVLENLADYHRQESFLDDKYAEITIHSATLIEGVYEADKLIENITIEHIWEYETFLKSIE